MTTCSDLADYEWLTGSEAGAILAELAEDNAPLHTAIARLRQRFTIERAHLLIEQTELRRRATAKFTQAHQMFFTRIGLEQATDEWVARYKASRFQQAATPEHAVGFVADLCCGIGGDLQALAATANAFGVDRDPITAHFAAINTRSQVHTTDITTLNLQGADAFHIDPDRRPTGKRTTSLEHCEPDLATINQLLATTPNAAIKLAPATEVPLDWSANCELEWISRDRECRQQVAWHGHLANAHGQHRATILPPTANSQIGPPSPPRTITGTPKQPSPLTNNPNRYVFDIDAAVLAAKLKGALANQLNLSALSAGPTYLTGDACISDPALSTFEVIEVMPYRIEKLAQHLRVKNIGQLEIKKRGVDLDLEKLRRQLKLRGDNAATLLITPIGRKSAAILAHRIAAH